MDSHALKSVMEAMLERHAGAGEGGTDVGNGN